MKFGWNGRLFSLLKMEFIFSPCLRTFSVNNTPRGFLSCKYETIIYNFCPSTPCLNQKSVAKYFVLFSFVLAFYARFSTGATNSFHKKKCKIKPLFSDFKSFSFLSKKFIYFVFYLTWKFKTRAKIRDLTGA